MVFIQRPIADIMKANIQVTLFLSPFQDAGVEVGIKNLGEERKDVKSHAVILAERMPFRKVPGGALRAPTGIQGAPGQGIWHFREKKAGR